MAKAKDIKPRTASEGDWPNKKGCEQNPVCSPWTSTLLATGIGWVITPAPEVQLVRVNTNVNSDLAVIVYRRKQGLQDPHLFQTEVGVCP